MTLVEHPVSRETVQAEGRRPYRRQAQGTCCVCHQAPARDGQRDCDRCHADTMRKFRAVRRLVRIIKLQQRIAADTKELARLERIHDRLKPPPNASNGPATRERCEQPTEAHLA